MIYSVYTRKLTFHADAQVISIYRQYL